MICDCPPSGLSCGRVANERKIFDIWDHVDLAEPGQLTPNTTKYTIVKPWYNQIKHIVVQTWYHPNTTKCSPKWFFLFFFFILDWDLAWPRWLGWNTPNTTNTTSYCNQKPNKTLISKNIRHLRLCRSSTAGAINILQLVNNTNLQLICAQIVCCILTKGELRHHMWRINHLINHYSFSWVFSTVNPKTAYSAKL